MFREQSRFTYKSGYSEFLINLGDELPLEFVETALLKILNPRDVSLTNYLGARNDPKVIRQYAIETRNLILQWIFSHHQIMSGDVARARQEIKINQIESNLLRIEWSIGDVSYSEDLFIIAPRLRSPPLAPWQRGPKSPWFQRSIKEMLGSQYFESEVFNSALRNYGWQEDSPSPRAQFHFRPSRPDQIVVAYRGMRVSEEVARKIFTAGEFRSPSNGTQDLATFLRADADSKRRWLTDQLRERVSGMYAGQSDLIGLSLDPRIGSAFGNFVFEVHIPREARIPVQPGMSKSGEREKEIFVPFHILPEWIKKVTNTQTGEVLLVRE